MTNRYEHVNELNSKITKAGKVLGNTLTKLQPKLAEMKSKKDFIGYIVFGETVVEYLLREMMNVYIHAINFSILKSDEKLLKPYDLLLFMKPNERLSSGKILDFLHTNFNFANIHKAENKHLREVVNMRNNIAHELISKHQGNIEKMNDEIEQYAIKLPIENAIIHLVNIQLEISNHLLSIEGLPADNKKMSLLN